jgi:hypothetical protein
MKLQRFEDVRVSAADVVFRQSPRHTGILVAILFAAAAGACCLAVLSGDIVGRIVGWFAAAGLGLLGLFVFGLFRKTLGAANWLVRMTPGGEVTVKFRSYANAHFPAEDVVAFTLAPGEIRWVRAATDRTLKRMSRAGGGGSSVQKDRRRYLDLAVDESIAKQIDQQLTLERGRHGPSTGRIIKSQSKVLDYPVSVADGNVIRIEFRGPSTWISPRLPNAVELLERHVSVKPAVDEGVRDLTSAKPEDASEKIRALAASGDEIRAIELARQVYGGSLAEARDRVKKLIEEPNGSPGIQGA